VTYQSSAGEAVTGYVLINDIFYKTLHVVQDHMPYLDLTGGIKPCTKPDLKLDFLKMERDWGVAVMYCDVVENDTAAHPPAAKRLRIKEESMMSWAVARVSLVRCPLTAPTPTFVFPKMAFVEAEGQCTVTVTPCLNGVIYAGQASRYDEKTFVCRGKTCSCSKYNRARLVLYNWVPI
jgi:hypothetical protein